MRRVFSVQVQEVVHLTRECMKWIFVGVLLLISMWFLTDGLPRVVAVINGLTSAGVIQQITPQLQ